MTFALANSGAASYRPAATGRIHSRQTSILSAIPWREAAESKFIASTFIERIYGSQWATLATALILVTALGSVFAAMLGYSRVPYAAAADGNFISVFARVHPTKHFPYVSLLALGVAALVFCLALNLGQAIRSILAMRCIIQFIAQGVGLILLRRRWGAAFPRRAAFARRRCGDTAGISRRALARPCGGR